MRTVNDRDHVSLVLNDYRLHRLKRIGDGDNWYLALFVPGHLKFTTIPYKDPIEEENPHPQYRRYCGTLDHVISEAAYFLGIKDGIVIKERSHVKIK